MDSFCGLIRFVDPFIAKLVTSRSLKSGLQCMFVHAVFFVIYEYISFFDGPRT
jgi:hypothetical protein